MKDKFFVPYETAKALKEKGYPQEIDKIFFDGRIVTRHIGIKHMNTLNIVAAPTYHEVVDWLESSDIVVIADLDITNNGVTDKWVGMWWTNNKQERKGTDCFNTREEALNAAILKALELI